AALECDPTGRRQAQRGPHIVHHGSVSNIREAVMDLERHVSEQGWDQPLELYALVPTAELLKAEPAAARLLGIDEPSDPGQLTPVQQEQLPSDVPWEGALGGIHWREGS